MIRAARELDLPTVALRSRDEADALVVRPGDACPSRDGLRYRDPANDPDSPSCDGDDNGIPDRNENDDWGSTGSNSGGSTTSGGSGGGSYNPGGCPPGGCDNSRQCPPGGCKS